MIVGLLLLLLEVMILTLVEIPTRDPEVLLLPEAMVATVAAAVVVAVTVLMMTDGTRQMCLYSNMMCPDVEMYLWSPAPQSFPADL